MMSSQSVVFVVFGALTVASNLPNILFIMADDLGWGNVNWEGHNPKNDEIYTPNMDDLVTNGLQLHRHYVDTACSPTRASFQTGRLPVHCTTNLNDGINDPTKGIPTQMTTIASKLKLAGYNTSLVGKWDNGFATYAHLPLSKGYDSFFGYLDMSIQYFSKESNACEGITHIDLWEDNAPAYTYDDTEYVEFMFMERVLDLIDSYSGTNAPFFLMYSMHLPHAPSEIPQAYMHTYGNDESLCTEDPNTSVYGRNTLICRSVLQSQVNLMDFIIGLIVARLKDTQLYENTLIVFTTDNGGSLHLEETAGNNYPLRGGKLNFFEGGIRATSFVSGGFLPQTRRGQIESGLMHVSDWYSTFCALAGIDSNDSAAVALGLPGVDGMNLWPLLSGQASESPRYELIIEQNVLIRGNYKLMRVDQCFDIWAGVQFPNASTADIWDGSEFENACIRCETDEKCLFDVVNDRSEYHNLAASMPALVSQMNERLTELSLSFWTNEESGMDSCPAQLLSESGLSSCGCWMAVNNYDSFAGPYQDLSAAQMHFSKEESILNRVQLMSNERMFESVYPWLISLIIMCALLLGTVAVIIKCSQLKVNGNNNNYNKSRNNQQTLYGSVHIFE